MSYRILKSVLRKAESEDWDEGLAVATQRVNGRVIHHLHIAPSTTLLGLKPSAAHLDAKLVFVPEGGVLSWVEQETEPVKHSRLVREYCNYRA